ncbi:coiled-coil alpha-helical rod protein 1 isoform X5 [Macaca nemestrina]|uniref:coiled-coil alpha-helical rod protein 1 isoform X4 n=2 Tax=Papio anubis TaxID=9555 RepID=UPI0005F36CA1|nr:coiled-coil alpha-helical rod protein 1 isoform X4 [Papio anubis]XP_011769142.1 coiled-coil alpha-helical rod protein 1 isoform X4 [Macaca nemestrina]
MWPHSAGARPWASTLIGKDPRVMAWWCLDGIPPGLAEPWRELWRWRSRPLHCVPPFSPLARGSRDHRNLRRRVKALPRILKGNIDGWRQNLEPSNNVEMFPPSGHQDVSERRLDTQRPQVTMWKQDVSSDRQEPGRRGRSWELEGSQALSQQAEVIARQLQELRRLEEEVRLLRETSLQQKMRLEAQAMELEALAQAEKAGRAEAEGLRAALAGAEVVRKNLEEGSQRELEEVQRLHQEQLSSLTQAHQEALSSLTSKAEGLEQSLSSLETRRAGEAKELAEAQREAELLRKQLSKTQEDLEAQVTLVENLRKYVGEQVPPEVHSQTWELERQKFLENMQHLQEDRDGLHATVELLQVRVQSLTHILALQEEELTRKVQPSDSLEPEFTRKCQSLLNRWREKVFALMVQLKAQELEHSDSVKQLKGQVTSLQEQVTAQSQEQAILQRSLQDKAAEVEVERMGSRGLQLELSRAQEARRRWQQQTTSAEEQLRLVVNAVSSSQIWLESTMAKVEEAAARLPSLNNRLSYAVRKVHTIRGLTARKLALAQLRQESCPLPPPVTDVSLELQQLREERNRLDAELQLSARLIQQEVGRAREQGEAERQQLSKVAQQLEQELQQTQESLASLGLQLEVARQGQQESTEEAASLRQELTQQQDLYRQALQEKVAEVETRLREQLSDTERRLNEARREHAKAVVSLRQIQRRAAQEKERSQELRRLQEEARKEEGQRLARRLQELERDKNLMLATLQQEGLLSRYKQQRLLAVLPSLLDKKKSVVSSPRPPECSASVPVAAAVPTRESIKGSLSVLLDDLQGLSEAISKEEAVCQGDNLDRCSSSNPQMSS